MDEDKEDEPVRDPAQERVEHVDDTDIKGHHSMWIDIHEPLAPENPVKITIPGDEDMDEAGSPSPPVEFLLGTTDDEEHHAHQLFCEMDQLFFEKGQYEWKEVARWVKFEEDVEEGGDRWSKPHVATLSLHSLFELRSCILNGTIILDYEGFTLPEIVDGILASWMGSEKINQDTRNILDAILNQHHRHPHHHNLTLGMVKSKGSMLHAPFLGTIAEIGKKLSTNRLNEEAKLKRDDNKASDPSFDRHKTVHNEIPHITHTHATEPYLTTKRSDSELSLHSSNISRVPTWHKFNEHFLKKIPPGSETANILIGGVEFLEHSVVALVRLKSPVVLGDLTEVNVPSRFVFILLGPQGNTSKYFEMGRAMATLMSDEVFNEVAYKAKSRGALLAGIDEFLDNVTVLPPGEWDPSIRIEPPSHVPHRERGKNGKIENQVNGHDGVDAMEDLTDPALRRTHRLFGGLVQDIRRKRQFCLSEFRDALHIQSLASVLFLYFACLTSIVTFGGLLGDATKNNMASFESILAAGICGCCYHLFAGQPLTIIGSTGPVLVFESIVFDVCDDYKWDYLPFRCCIGLWMCLILMGMVMFDLSSLVSYITRFTEEGFAALICVIFIYESIKEILEVQDLNPVNYNPHEPLNYNCTCMIKVNSTLSNLTTTAKPINPTSAGYFNDSHVQYYNDTIPKELCAHIGGVPVGGGCDTPNYVPDVFFFSLLLYFGTFTIAILLKSFKSSRFFATRVRGLISDFAVVIAIVSMVTWDIFTGIDTPKLHIPENFRPTRDDRGWFISPVGNNPWWTVFVAILPAFLVTILIFMDQQITAVIVNRKENKLLKGHGYHLDLFVLTILIGICSIMGLPWLVAATVLSITHIMSLKKESTCTAPGEKPHFLGVREQRVTGFLVFFLIGASIVFKLTSFLKHIPLPVLYGVFLYMGVSSLKGVQLIKRILIILMPSKAQPDYMFLRHVRTWRVHLFTGIQVLCLALLWVIKSIKETSIVFPIMVLALCFIRRGLEYIFSLEELKWLDDMMPNAHRRKAEEELKKKKEEEKLRREEANNKLRLAAEESGGMLNILVPLTTGNVLHIPANRKFSIGPQNLNLSQSLATMNLWKKINQNEKEEMAEKSDDKPVPRKRKSKKYEPLQLREKDKKSPDKELYFSGEHIMAPEDHDGIPYITSRKPSPSLSRKSTEDTKL